MQQNLPKKIETLRDYQFRKHFATENQVSQFFLITNIYALGSERHNDVFIQLNLPKKIEILCGSL